MLPPPPPPPVPPGGGGVLGPPPLPGRVVLAIESSAFLASVTALACDRPRVRVSRERARERKQRTNALPARLREQDRCASERSVRRYGLLSNNIGRGLDLVRPSPSRCASYPSTTARGKREKKVAGPDKPLQLRLLDTFRTEPGGTEANVATRANPSAHPMERSTDSARTSPSHQAAFRRFGFGGFLAGLGGVEGIHHLRLGVLELLVRQLAVLVHLPEVRKRKPLAVKILVRRQSLARPRHADEQHHHTDQQDEQPDVNRRRRLTLGEQARVSESVDHKGMLGIGAGAVNRRAGRARVVP